MATYTDAFNNIWTYTTSNITALTLGAGVTTITMPDNNGLGQTFLTFTVAVFSGKTTLTSITIGNTYTSIPTGSASAGAFYNCTSLTTLVIGNAVTSIGAYACEFSATTGVLSNLTIGNNVQTISTYAFSYCHHLTSITIPNNVQTISTYAFQYCTGIVSITFTETSKLTNLSDYAFQYCTALTSIIIPDSVTALGASSFYGCSLLATVVIGNGVITINNYAFQNCTALISLIIGTGVTTINQYVFRSCIALINVTIPNKVTSCDIGTFQDCTSLITATVGPIASRAMFYGCTKLTTVIFNDNPSYMGQDVFNGCTSLTNIYFRGLSYPVSGVGSNWLLSTPATLRGHAIPASNFVPPGSAWNTLTMGAYTDEYTSGVWKYGLNGTNATISDYTGVATNLTIPDSIDGYPITNITIDAFNNCNTIISLTFNNIIATLPVGSSATVNLFYGCNALASVTLSTQITNITAYTFYNRQAMTTYTIPASITTIGDYAFAYSGLLSLTIPNTVTTLGLYSLAYCSSLSSITLPTNLVTIPNYFMYYCTALTSLIIPNTVTGLSTYAFAYCSSLNSISFGTALTTLGSYTFSYCTGLTTITIPNYITTIGGFVFNNCSGLITANIGNGVTSLSVDVFSYCTSLNTITIGTGLTTIGSYAFRSCTVLSSIIFLGLTAPATVNANWLTSAPTSVRGHANVASNFPLPGAVWNTLRMSTWVDHVASGDWTYVVIANKANIDSYSGGNTVVIPETLDGYVVDKFMLECFNYKPITAFNSGNSLTLIPDGSSSTVNAFYGCAQLTTVVLGNACLNTGNYTFYNIISLNSFTASAITSIGTYTFYGCTSLATVVIPSTLITIGSYALAGCTSLRTITLPSSLTTIGSRAFESCGLTAITIPNSVTSIGVYGFNSCLSLITANIGNGVPTLEVTTSTGDFFYYCTALTTVTIASGVTKLGYELFAYCTALVSLTFLGLTAPSVSSSWKSNAGTPKVYARQASNFPLPETLWNTCTMGIWTDVTTSGDWKYGVNNGNAIICNYIGANTVVTMPNTIDGYNVTAFLVATFANNITNVTSLTLGSLITAIPPSAFVSTTKLKNIVIPISITSIGSSAFYGAGITSLLLPNSVTYIGQYAFRDCESLITANLGNGVPTLETTTSTGAFFYSCENLTNVIIASGITKIGYELFYTCTKLASITFLGLVAPTSAGSNCLYSVPASVRGHAYTASNFPAPGSSLLTILTMGTRIETDYPYTFTVTNNELTITGYTGAGGLLTIPATLLGYPVKYIGASAFLNVTTITSLVISTNTTTLGNSAFSGCTGITLVTMSDSLTTIGNNVFEGCTNLLNIIFLSTTMPTCGTNWLLNANANILGHAIPTSNFPPSGSILPNGEVRGANGLLMSDYSDGVYFYTIFNNLVTITKYIGPAGVVAIPSTFAGYNTSIIGSNSFSGRTDITSVTTFRELAEIGASAFAGCTSLSSIYLGNSYNPTNGSFTTIGASAFSGCIALVKITFYMLVAPTNVGAEWILNTNAGLVGRAVVGSNFPSKDAYFNGLLMSYIAEEDYYTYTGTTTLTLASYIGPGGVTVIPSTIGGKTVVSIGTVFANSANRTLITSLVIPDTVTLIGDAYVIRGCTNLISINIGNGCTRLGPLDQYGTPAIYDNPNLETLYIGSALTAFGNNNYGLQKRCDSCPKWKETIVSSSNATFASVDGVLFNKNITTLYAYPTGKTGASYTHPSTVTRIEGYAFYSNLYINEFTTGSNVISVWDYAFASTQMTRIYISDSVTTLSGAAHFSGCTKLTRVTFGKGLTTLASNVYADIFSGCSLLGEAQGGDGVIFLSLTPPVTPSGRWCGNTNVRCHASNDSYFPVTGQQLQPDGMMGSTFDSLYYTYTDNGSNITLDSYIGPGGALIMPPTMNGKPVVTFTENCYKNNNTITSLTIVSTITSIPIQAFIGCTVLTTISVAATNPNYSNANDGIVYNKNITTLIQCPLGRSGIILVPATVTSIANYAFKSCASVTKVTMQANLTNIGISAFESASTLVNLNFESLFSPSVENDWILNTPVTIRGHAYSTSNFPSTGDEFNGLIMGSTLDVAQWLYTEAGGVATVTGYTGSGGTIVMPSILDGYPCTSFALNLFQGKSTITSITIPDSYTAIPTGSSSTTGAFYGCTALNTLIIGNGVLTVGAYACYGLSSIINLTFGNNITTIGGYAFYQCNGLVTVNIPDSVTSIGTYAFYNCTNLVTLYVSKATYGAYVFYNNPSLKYVTIASGVTTMGAQMFHTCSVLTSITFLGLVAPTSFGTSWIVNVPTTCRGHAYAASNFPDSGGVLSTLTMGSHIGDNGWVYTIALNQSTITLYDGSETNVIMPITIGGFPVVAFTLATFQISSTSVTSITISEGITSIPSGSSSTTGAFYNCTVLNSVIMPSTLTTIGDYAFYGRTALTNVSMTNIVSIGAYAFYGCNNAGFNSINFGNALTTIGTYAFWGCTYLTSITLPTSCTTLGTYTFYGCTRLASVNLGSGVSSLPDYAFYQCVGITSLSVPNSVTSIGSNTFNGCTYLTSLTIPDTTTTLGTYVFNGCTRLATLILGASVSNVPDYALYQCVALTSISMPNSVTSIGSYALAGCTGLSSITISTSVVTIGSYAFNGSNNFTTISIPNSVTTIGINAFQSCTKLITVSIGTGLAILQNYLFASCTAIVNITLPNNITTINTYCFTLCTGLKTVTIGTGLTTIGTYVFNGCTALYSITFGSLTAPTSVGASWLTSVPTAVRGHAPRSSNFPAIGAILPVGQTQGASGLMMGSYDGDDGDNGWIYTIASNQSTVTGYDGPLTVITIPSTLGTYPTVAFTLTAFNAKAAITSITICDSITAIPTGSSSTANAFYGCTALNTINLGNGVQTIGGYAFYGRTVLANVTFGTAVVTIETYAFQGCTSLVTLTFNNAMNTIATYAFSACTSLLYVICGTGLTTIGTFVFNGCTAIKTIIFNGNTAPTCGASWLTSVPTSVRGHAKTSGTTFPAPGAVLPVGQAQGASGLLMGSYIEANGWLYTVSGTTTITGYDLFETILVMPDVLGGANVTAFTLTAMNSKASVTSITLASGITNIPVGSSSTVNAFYGCTSLATIVINANCTNIGAYAFYGRTNLVNITWGGVNTIGNQAFTNCNNVNFTSIIIPNTVTSIGINAFENCNKLTSIILPSNITTINDATFLSCSSLQTITIPDGVTTIGVNAFTNCTSLTSVIIGSNITILGAFIFNNCTALQSIKFLSLAKPSVGVSWVLNISLDCRGHAYRLSNFPTPGNLLNNVLTMGSYILELPGAPTLISASAGSAQVSLTWTAPEYTGGTPLTAYLVRYSLNSDLTNYTEIQVDDTVLTLVVMEMPSGVYWFGIIAQNSVGNSTVSNKLSAQPFSYPDPPTLDSATPMYVTGQSPYSKVRINWTAPQLTGGTALTGYKIYYDSSPTNPPSTLRDVVLDDILQYDTISLTPGTLYYFGVSAVNASDESPISNVMSATPYTLPSAPTMSDLSVGYRQVDVRWNAPVNTGYTTIINYKIYSGFIYDPDNPLPTLRATVGGGLTQTTITGLEGGRRYYFAVVAVNAAGDSEQSDVLFTDTPYVEPDAPVLSGTVYAAQVNLTWTTPTSDGGQPIDYYIIYQDNVPLSTHYTGNSADILGLTDNVEYVFKIAAHNSIGLGATSNALPLTPHPVPPNPPVIEVSAKNDSAFVSWEAPFNGGSPILNYNMYYGTNTPDTLYATVSYTVLSGTIINLTHGVEYIFGVTAISSIGESDMSNTPTAIPYTYAGAPTILEVLVGGSNQAANTVEVKWSQPGDNGASRLTGYKLWYGTTTTPTTYKHANYSDSPTQKSLITDLTVGLTYYFSVSAINAAGDSPRSSELEAIPYRISDPPELTSATPDGVGCLVPKITIAWLEPSITGYTPILNYTIYRRNAGASRTQIAVQPATSRSYIDTNILAGVLYYYSITATNVVDESNHSSERSATSYCVPSAPYITAITAQNLGASAIISWNASASNGGKTITKYDVFYGTNPDSLSLYASYGSSARTAQVSGLTPGIRYYFGVKSYSEWGYSEFSNIASILPDPPVLLDVVPHINYANLTWAAPVYTGGVDITGYEVYYGTTEIPTNKFGATLGSEILSISVTDLSEDTLYYFGLKTVTYVGNSDISNIKDNILSAPTCYSEFGTNEIIAHWAANVDGGEPIVGYKLYYGITTNPATLYGTYANDVFHVHITDLSVATRYYFAAKAYNNIGTSPSSASVTPPTGSVPTPPSINTVYSGSRSTATLDWTDTGNNTTYPITGYVVYYGLSSLTNFTSIIPASLKSYTISGLTSGATYRVAIKAINVNGYSTMSEQRMVTVVSAPSAPTNFTLVVNGTSIDMSWTNGDIAQPTKYNIYRGDISYNQNNDRVVIWTDLPIVILNGSILNYTVSNLTAGLEYAFRINAENAAGVSTYSTKYATPVAVPDILTFSGVASSRQVVLHWTANPNGSAIDYYTIYQYGVALPNTYSITTATLTGLSNDVTYTYRVAAHNAIGTGLQSSQISLTPRPNLPTAPGNLTAIPAKGLITLTWDTPTETEGIDYYVVYFNGNRMAGEPTGNTTTFTASQEYTYTVAAHNSAGIGALSDPVTMAPLSDTPGKPSLDQCTATTTKVVLVWHANATGLAGPNTGFKVVYGTNNNPTTLYQTYGPDVFTADIYGLTVGVNYYFGVIATNTAGDSLRSNVRNARTFTIPTVPVDFGRINGNALIQLYWSAPASDGASPILYYNIYKGETVGSLINIANTTTLVYADSSVLNGGTYYYAVSAVNAAGEGPSTDPTKADPVGEPSKPQMKSAVAGKESVTVVWGPPIQLAGNILTGYKLYYGTTFDVSDLYGQYDAATTTVTISNLIAGTRYYFSVTAILSPSGETAKCAPLAATPYNNPDAPILSLVSVGVMSILIEWTEPDNNGSALTGYKVYYGELSPTTQYQGTFSPSVKNVELINMDPAKTYKLAVYAINAAGNSISSNIVEATPDYGLCAPPTFSAPIAGASKVTLNWTAPSYTGGSPVTGYQLYMGTNINVLTPLATVPSSPLTYVVTALTPNTKYYFAIKALSAIGGSGLSDVINCTPYADVPTKPTLVSATPTGREVVLTWTPNYDGGAAITFYRVYYGLSASLGSFYQQYVAGTASASIAGLTPGVLYYFGVCALNSRGISETSNILSATVDPNIIGAPTNLTATAGNKQITLNWVAPALTGTSPIQYYTIYMNGNTIMGTPTGLTYTVPNLTNGVYYTFTVAAHNATIEGDRSLMIGATPLADKPSAPLSLIGTAGNTQALLTWVKPTSDGGADIDYYLLYQDGVLVPGTINDILITVSSLINGRSYAFKVCAHNIAGLSVASNEVNVTPSDIPGAPTNLVAVAHKASVALSWNAPLYTGGLTISNYTVYKDGVVATTVGTTNATISGLINGQTYLFYVVANNATGTSTASSVISATPFDTPSAPQNLTGTAGSTRVKLYWAAPVSDGGASIDYYVVYKNNIDILHTTELTATIKNLTNGTPYTFNIAAHNSGGIGFQSVPLYIMPISTTTDAAIFDGIMVVDLSQTFAHGAAVAYVDDSTDDYEKLVVEIGTYILGYWNGAMTLPKDVN